MKSLIVPLALLLAGVAAAQSTDTPQYYQEAGTIDLATGAILPPNTVPNALSATTGILYLNNAGASGGTSGGYWPDANLLPNAYYIDDGRVPSRSSPSPATGVLDSYEISSFRVVYGSGELDPNVGGPGTSLSIYFWDDYDAGPAFPPPTCQSFAAAGTPTKQFTFAGLRGSTSTNNPPTIAYWAYVVNVPAASWYMKGDADGVYNGVANLDTFGWGISFTAAGTPGALYGLFKSGSYNTPKGDGTYFQNSAATAGTGLGNSNYFTKDRTPNGASVQCWTGSSTQVGEWGGYNMQITAIIDDCNGNGQPDSLDCTNGAPDCDLNGVPDSCELAAGAPDCNGNGLLDVCDIASGTSFDGNSNGIPDECECGFVTNYCTPGTTSSGCIATIGSSGTAQASATAGSGFFIDCTNLEPGQSGILFYGVHGGVALPWGPTATATSFMCVKSPVDRTTGVQNTGGSGACSGTMSIDWNLYIATTPGAQGTPFVGGESVWAQGWFRDPPATKTTSLTDGLRFTVCP